MPFVKLSESDKPARLVVSVFGREKEGKTHFSLTAPEPFAFISLDPGVRELTVKFPGKKIHVAEHEMTEVNDPATYAKLLKAIHADYLDALASHEFDGGTIVVDTATQLWQIIQKVKLDVVYNKRVEAWRAKHNGQEPGPNDVRLFPFDYADANTYMGGLIRRAMFQHTKNVIFINRAKERYDEGGRPLGQYSYQGYNEMPAIVQMTLRLFTRRSPDDPKSNIVMGRIESCRFDKGSEGLEIEWPEFDTFRAMFA